MTPEIKNSEGHRRPDSQVIDAAQEQRIRAAWLYYVEGLNQQQAADVLGLTRLQVTRLLADARRRGEINIQINSDLKSIVATQRKIETRFGVKRVSIALRSEQNTDPVIPIAVAAGRFISNYVQSGMNIGVGWGRTLYSALPHIEGRDLEDVQVVSLLGGISEARRYNPAEFAWQFATRFNGNGYLVPAPALVDSIETRNALLERCGINKIFDQADSLDVAFISAGGIMNLNTSYRVGHLSEADRQSLIKAGVVGDILYNFINIKGEIVDHPVNDRAISIEISKLKRAKDIVLISGGREKIEALIGTLLLLEPDYFITDEVTASIIADYEI
ncbi:MAG: sugar-binding transcriptional regulator [Gammaproteobacteria bacterium]|nr:sugar-binding transcriptional regulator [Gammaproteobacteria bacterium]